jgi:hypothetical protein
LVLSQMVGSLSGSRATMRNDMLGWPPMCIARLVFMFRCLNSESLYFYVRKTWFVII